MLYALSLHLSDYKFITRLTSNGLGVPSANVSYCKEKQRPTLIGKPKLSGLTQDESNVINM